MDTGHIDPTADISHRDDIPWHEAPLPPVDHRCGVQTSGWLPGLVQILRCSCGALAYGLDLKPYEGRHLSDERWNSFWIYRNSRHKDAASADGQVGADRPATTRRPWWRRWLP